MTTARRPDRPPSRGAVLRRLLLWGCCLLASLGAVGPAAADRGPAAAAFARGGGRLPNGSDRSSTLAILDRLPVRCGRPNPKAIRGRHDLLSVSRSLTEGVFAMSRGLTHIAKPCTAVVEPLMCWTTRNAEWPKSS